MGDIRFTKAESSACPRYKDYYIQDRVAGRDVYGHETYEYALFRSCGFELVRKFRTRKQAYRYVGDKAYISRFEAEHGSGRVVRDREWLGVYTHDRIFKIIKRTNEVLSRPVNDERLTGWCMTYQECLAEAKELVRELERDAVPMVQYSLWDE